MPDIVVKFGGSNLREKSDVLQLVKIIKAYKKSLVIVISANYGITDYLFDQMTKIRNQEAESELVSRYLEQLYRSIIDENFDDNKSGEKAWLQIRESILELERYLLGVSCIGESPDFLEDLILSYGERLSAILLNNLLAYHNIKSKLIYPGELPLITDGEFGNASVDFGKSSEKVRQTLSSDIHYIIPGFFGISPEGKTTILGRGGSDYSAAAIARCIKATSLDIWKDVNGFLSGDPKIVSHPVLLERITYAEAAELAYFGARILHPRTVEPLQDCHIPIRIFNIKNGTEKFKPLSVVNSEEVVREGVVKSVTYSDDFCLLKLKGPGVGIKPGILAKATTILNKNRINISSVITSQIAINLLLSKKDLKKALALVKSLELNAVNDIIAIRNISLIAVVGQGMLENHGIAARMFNAVARKRINVQMSSTGASQVVSYFVVDNKDRTEAVCEIHKEFFEKRRKKGVEGIEGVKGIVE